MAGRWNDSLDLIAKSVAENGGRSCVNASGVWTPAHGREIAEALAARLSAIVPRAADDPQAELAPFVDPRVAKRLSRTDRRVPAGARRRGHFGAPSFRSAASCSTTAARTCCRRSSTARPLRIRSRIASSCFRSSSVVDVLADEMAAMPACMGSTLVVTALTHDQALIDRLLGSDLIGRLNLGPIQTNTIAWDQPHEGNLFDHLYGRRAFQHGQYDRRSMRLLYLTAGAAEMYCGSCLRDNALAAALLARGHDVLLTPIYTPTTTDEPNAERVAGVLRRRERVPRAARPAVPPHAGLSRPGLGFDRRAAAGIEAADQGRPHGAGEDDRVDAERRRGISEARKSARC